MNEFYAISWKVHILIIVILGLCVLMQTLALILNFYRNNFNKTLAFQCILEFFILCEILVFSLLHGQMLSSYRNGFLVPSGYEQVRVFVFLVIFILVIIVCILSGQWLPLSVIPAAAISLPMMENILDHLFPWFFTGALMFFLIRSIRKSSFSIIGIQTNISALSVTHAIDILNTGILFSENDGYILLSNEQMRKMMIAITGRLFRNAIQFYDAVLSDKYQSRYQKIQLDGQMVCLLPDGTAWMFAKADIVIGLKNYIHISVADVTELWILTTKLQLQDQALRNKSNQLKKTMANLHTLSQEKEIESAKIRAHDILGQRLTVLLRIIQNQGKVDYDLLTSLSKGLLAELKAEHNEPSPADKLESIQHIFAAIGIDITIEGQLPDSSQEAQLFIDIIREGSTNAVRHGLATQINIKLKALDHSYQLTINNNGYTPDAPITLGSGIRGMRKKVSAQGGSLEIRQDPSFTLSVVIPGGDEYV